MDPTARRRRTVLIAAIAGGLILLLLIGVGVYGLIRGPQTTEPAEPARPDGPTATSPTLVPAEPEPVVALGGPEEIAGAVAEALFTWDTSSGYGPADYAQMLANVTADMEADAAASDVRAYLPTAEAWAQLRTHQTRQWLTIDTIETPAAWDDAVVQAAPGQIPDGAVAYTITGTRHRTGYWGADRITTTHEVAFTVFLTCTPDRNVAPPPADPMTENCSLLRLSLLDNPLR
ncbi:hypothetical protein [Microbacteriaceae]|uniref:Uncharacterized protein n=3 Tax=Microbacteriaceae TaxID=85023 RepID=A0A1R4J329_9MICO|nr:hypothetical protein [Microbacteriaceae]RLP67559.1 hypothetical protein D9V30_13925 [Mycetocola reblochoni]TDP90119.1 hypothetical protein EDF62_2684 [Leucobacter luti]SJN26175.1 hypothetical protein FM119_04955 [Mycetocola reblochoni REB411]